jgi:hypothetical protein
MLWPGVLELGGCDVIVGLFSDKELQDAVPRAARSFEERSQIGFPRGNDSRRQTDSNPTKVTNGGIMGRFQNAIILMGFRGWVNSAAEEFRKKPASVITATRLFVLRRGIWTAFWIWLVAMGVLCRAVPPVWAQESSEIAKQAQNPIARLISVPVENDFNPQTGINKEDSYVLQFKPVVPIRLSNDWNLITRTIVPVIQLPDLAPGVNGTTGLGDVNLSLFLSPAKVGRIIWGVGPIVSFPTATEDILGTKKLSVGPTVVALRSQGHWLYGILVNNLFSVAGPSARADVNQMLAQPFVNYNLRHGWYLTSSPIITANWEATRDQRWTVPVGGGVGKIVHFGPLPVNMYTQVFGNAVHPDRTTNWSARFQVQFLFPKKR